MNLSTLVALRPPAEYFTACTVNASTVLKIHVMYDIALDCQMVYISLGTLVPNSMNDIKNGDQIVCTSTNTP